MACSYQNCQMLLSHIISHLSLFCEKNSGVSGCVTSWHSDSIQLTETAGKNKPKPNQKKNRSFWFWVGSGWEVEFSVSCTPQGGHRGGQEATLNSALPSCKTGASQMNRDDRWGETHLDYKRNQQRT